MLERDLRLRAMTSLLAPTAAALLLPGAPTDVAALQRTLHRQGAALAATLCIRLATTAPALKAAQLDRFKECNKVVPGSGAYCTSTCSSYCEEQAALPAEEQDGLIKAGAAAAPAATPAQVQEARCNKKYKTDAAIEFCVKDAQKAAVAAKQKVGFDDAGNARAQNVGKDMGIFGDSGVTYGKGLEDPFATAFGATRQTKPNEVNVDSFKSEIFEAAKRAADPAAQAQAEAAQAAKAQEAALKLAAAQEAARAEAAAAQAAADAAAAAAAPAAADLEARPRLGWFFLRRVATLYVTYHRRPAPNQAA